MKLSDEIETWYEKHGMTYIDLEAWATEVRKMEDVVKVTKLFVVYQDRSGFTELKRVLADLEDNSGKVSDSK